MPLARQKIQDHVSSSAAMAPVVSARSKKRAGFFFFLLANHLMRVDQQGFSRTEISAKRHMGGFECVCAHVSVGVEVELGISSDRSDVTVIASRAGHGLRQT